MRILINSGVSRGWSQGENLAERGPLATIVDTLAKNQKKKLEIWWQW